MRHIRNLLWFLIGFVAIAIILLGCSGMPDHGERFRSGDMERLRLPDYKTSQCTTPATCPRAGWWQEKGQGSNS